MSSVTEPGEGGEQSESEKTGREDSDKVIDSKDVSSKGKKSRGLKSRSKTIAGSKANKSAKTSTPKEMPMLSVNSPHGSNATGLSSKALAQTAMMQARLDQMEQKLKVVSDLEEQIDVLTQQISQVRTLAMTKSQGSMSPTRSEKRSIKNLTRAEKREILRKRGKILDLKEVRKRTASQSPSSPVQRADMNDKLNQNRATVPLKWDFNQKKWMAPD